MDSSPLRQWFPELVSESLLLRDFCLDLILAGVLAWLLGRMMLLGTTPSPSKKDLARSLISLAITTTLVISVIKSSLALSLGLVGALSIIRFRTAIRDPEELSYIFLTFAIGIGLGAQQRNLVLVCIAVILIFRAILGLMTRKGKQIQSYIRISYQGNESYEPLLRVIRADVTTIQIRSFESSDAGIRLLLEVTGFEPSMLQEWKEGSRKLYSGLSLSWHSPMES